MKMKNKWSIKNSKKESIKHENESMYRKYNPFFDLKLKRILKVFHFSFFSFKIKIEKWKKFLKFIFWFQIKKWIRKFWFLFFEIGFKLKQIQKIFFRFSFFNSIIKFEKWKIFFEIRFFISNQKIIFKILKFVFRFLIWNGSHKSLFWHVGSKIELKLLWNWIKLCKTFTAVGLNVKENIIRMDKIDFNFFCQLLKENLCYAEISEIMKKNYPNVRGFSAPSMKNFCKKNGLSSRISQNDVNEMV